MNLSTRVRTVTRIMTISTLVATAALAIGYGLNRQPLGILIFIALGLLWLVGQRHTAQIFAGLGLLGFAIGALLGSFYGVQNAWTLVGITAALVVWDLHHFIEHIRAGKHDETAPADAETEMVRADTARADTARADTARADTARADTVDPANTVGADTAERIDAHSRALERVHLQRLAFVSGLGLLLGALALTVRVTLSFGVIILLGLVAIYGLSRLVHYLRQESD